MAFFALSLTFLTGCGGQKHAKVIVPPPPSMAPAEPSPNSESTPPAVAERPASAEASASRTPVEAKPLATETGLASWYGGVYNHRRGSNGEIYEM
ncbi:MAG TPA: hypothetical protein VEI52_15110, partial [Terriglobales bacterium]|nr:hypothetical protein [Terriglobales bacterium]